MKLSQTKRLYALLKDCKPHSTIEILERVYGVNHAGVARIASRINDLRNEGKTIDGWKDPNNPTVFIYRLKNPAAPTRKVSFEMRNGVMTAVYQ